MNENSLIRDIGRSYIVSSMMPAALFITLGVFIYRANIPQIFLVPILSDKYSASIYFLFAGLIMWTGFALYSMVNWTVRLYEGYYFPRWLKNILVAFCFKPGHRRKTLFIKKIQQAKKDKVANWEAIISENYDRAWADYSDVELSSPMREEDLLPTQLGNVLRASEQYPRKYGLNAGIDLWTRLVTLLPNKMADTLEEKNNNLLFLLNSSLLAYLLGIFAFGSWGLCRFNGYCSTNLKIMRAIGLSGSAANEYFLLGCLWLLVGYALYILSIPVAKTIGLLIRSSFDLYRLDLLKQLNQSLPTSLSQEKKVWIKVSDFIVTGGTLGTKPLEFEYELRNEYLSEQQGVEYQRSPGWKGHQR